MLPSFISPGADIQGLHSRVSGSPPDLVHEEVWIDVHVVDVVDDMRFTATVVDPDFPSHEVLLMYREGYFREAPP